MPVNQPGLNIFAGAPILSSLASTTGRAFYVGSVAVPGGVVGVDSAGAYGDSPKTPFASFDYAIGQCTANRGDTIYGLPNHAETVTTITADVAGIRIIGLGEGNARPAITGSAVADVLTVTADDVVVEGIRFPTPSAAVSATINVAAARTVLRRVGWVLGANIVDAVTITADGELPTFEDCDVTVSANGPDSWLKFEGVIDRPTIRRNIVIGSDGTNAFDDGVFDFDSVAVTNPVIYGNFFNGAGQTTTVVANGGAVTGACYGPNAYAGSATDADNISGGAANLTAITDGLWGTAGVTTWLAAAIPADTVSMAEVLRQVYAALEGTAASQNGVATWPAPAIPANNVSIAEVLGQLYAALMGTAGNWDGIATFPSAAAPANTVSVAEVVRALYNAVAHDSAASSTAVQTGFGRRVTKVGDVSAAPDDLFTVTGKCLITLMVGEVTSVIATTTSVAIYTSTNSSVIAAATQITADAAGTLYIVSGDPDDALNGGGTPGLEVAMVKTGVQAPFVMNDDKIYQSIDGAGTGLIQWDLYYIPLEDSASVASSA